MMKYVVKSPVRAPRYRQAHYVAPYHRRQAPAGPAINLRETDEAFILNLAAPGMSRENFSLKVDQETLIITASPEASQEEVKYTRQEFRVAGFERKFHLPETVNTEAIKASYEQGVLEIHLPKQEPEKNTRSITVQ